MATIGKTAPSQNTINYDDLLSTTFMAYQPVMADNIFKANAFLSAMRAYDGVSYQDGGERAQLPLMYEENGTVKSYKGYELLDTTPQDGITSAFYEWAEIAGTISISRREERQNSGEARMLELLQQKIQQAEMSMKSQINNQLVAGTISSNKFIPGNDGKDLLPLGYFMMKDNTADPSGTGVTDVGNISNNENAWWRPVTAVGNSATADTGNSFALSITTWKGMAVGMKRLYNYTSRGGDGSGPGIMLCDQETFEAYESSMDDKLRYADTKMADLGFDTIKCKGATVIWDELVPSVDEGVAAGDAAAATAGTVWAVNPKFMKLKIDRQTDFVTTPFVTPENQTARVAKTLFMGQLCSNNQRKHGVLYGMPTTITS
jgi:hypothetical protein